MDSNSTRGMVIATSVMVLATVSVHAGPVVATNFDSLTLGAKIVGPVGPEVETTFVNDDGNGVGDLVSSVSCPEGFDACLPGNNAPGTIYTYSHTATPGVDTHNDTPFPLPDTILPLNDVNQFQLGFSAEGFNGVAGYSFSQSVGALGTPDAITAEHDDNDGSLQWTVSTDAWDTGEPITFFWQTTQPPQGPGGIYSISNATTSGSGNGPLPTPVPEPGCGLWLGLAVWGIAKRHGRSIT